MAEQNLLNSVFVGETLEKRNEIQLFLSQLVMDDEK